MTKTVNEIDAARMLGLSVQTLRNYRYLRTGPPYLKLGRAVRYLVEDLEKYLAARRIVPEENEREEQTKGEGK
ncbi:MAG: helix-turn-helix domain-containing protein [Deltaproteobacteria bacterium]|nr:helix-turn-helix domain-containing protein [Deltaproteobacteria bacterium]MBW2127100.1 helix-turn-helix domain-containing protein [Deltaproteobacteria bacterium]